jgi:hypothetical protein
VIPAAAVAKLRAQGGKANGSLAGIGRMLGTKSKSASHRLIHQLAAASLIRLSTSPAGVSLALA